MSLRKHFLNKLLLAILVLPGLATAAPLHRMTWLPQDFTAAGLDGAGRVVGIAQGGAVVWSTGGATYLGPLLPGSESLAINNGGSIVGRVGSDVFVYAVGFSETHAFLYQSGAVTRLGSFDGTISVANAINASGHIAGFASHAGDGDDWGDPRRTAPVYRDGVQHHPGPLGGWSSEANAINDAGFGAVWSGPEDNFSERSFLFSPTDDRMLDLNALVGERGDWQLVNALDVNDAGQILAQACKGRGDCRAVRLDMVTAVPEPGTWAMLGAGLALLGWRARLRLRGQWRRIGPALLAAPLATAAPPAPLACSGSPSFRPNSITTP